MKKIFSRNKTNFSCTLTPMLTLSKSRTGRELIFTNFYQNKRLGSVLGISQKKAA